MIRTGLKLRLPALHMAHLMYWLERYRRWRTEIPGIIDYNEYGAWG